MKEKLEKKVADAKLALEEAEHQLEAYLEGIDQWTFAGMEAACGKVEAYLKSKAHADCEGSYCFGLDTYCLNFRVGVATYKGTLRCEYNRHDKTYYYLEESKFTYEPV